jgi:hypothetical protein
MKKQAKGYFWTILGAVFVLAAVARIAFPGEGLTHANITSSASYRPEWEIDVPDEKDQALIDAILAQPFSYLDEGGQSYVFSSADQKYVLKLFKFQRFRPYFFVQILPDIFPFHSFRNNHIEKRKQKLVAAFRGYRLAYERHRKESELLFIQLNPVKSSKSITVFDKYHRERKINLTNVPYVLQKKGEMLSIDLAKILDAKDLQSAKKRIDQLFELYLSEYQKGIYDLDHGIMHNIGSSEDALFHLDVGKLVYNEEIKNPELYKKDLNKITQKLQSWIQQRYPEYSLELLELTEYIEGGSKQCRAG